MANTTLSVTSGLGSSTGTGTLTGSGTIATSTSGDFAVVSGDAKRVGGSGKLYIEYVFNVRVSGSTAAGLMPVGYPAGTALAVVVQQNGSLYINGGSMASLGALANGDNIAFAFDFASGQVWARKNGGNWNANASANPATGIGGISMPSGFFAPWVRCATTNDKITANFGDSAFAYTVPSGFTSGWPSPGDPTALVETFAGAEIFGGADSNLQTTFVGAEVFAPGSDSNLQLSFIGLEVFRSTSDGISSALLNSFTGLEVFASVQNVAADSGGGSALLAGL